MANHIGERVRLTVFGQSHAPAIGAVIEGLPPGLRVDWDGVQSWLDRRAPGRNALSTSRREADIPRVLSGLNASGETCGAPLAVMIENTDARSSDYNSIIENRVPRPGHADYPAWAKYGAAHDPRGGGMFSGRLTAPLVIAGAVAAQVLSRDHGVATGVRIAECAGIGDRPRKVDPVDRAILAKLAGQAFPVLDDSVGERMRSAILEASAARDSVGGVVEAYAVGVPPGWGEPMFGGLENRIAQVVFGVPAVRGIAFGAGDGSGFAAAGLRGSGHNDAFYLDDDGRVRTRTNRHGGILGGISTGMPIVFEAAFKPTPTIGIRQDTVELNRNAPATLNGSGRHDPCVAQRAAPVVEAALAFALLDASLVGKY
ncbi:MAG: chorismate synthase [Oscillospiraceae bacterium]|nr:chorismate synthase [Oscillospiraceae bacterium]